MAHHGSIRLYWLGVLALGTGLLLAPVLAMDTGAAPDAATQAGTQPGATKPAPPKIVVNEEVALKFFHDFEPDVYQQMLVLKDKDKAKYLEFIKGFYREVGHLLDLQQKNEPLFKITMEDRRVGFASMQLARTMQAGGMTAAELDKANADLAALVARQFDLRQQLRQAALDEQKARIADIQKAIDTLTAQFSDRQKCKDDLIKQRINDLMQKNPKVEW